MFDFLKYAYLRPAMKLYARQFGGFPLTSASWIHEKQILENALVGKWSPGLGIFIDNHILYPLIYHMKGWNCIEKGWLRFLQTFDEDLFRKILSW